MLFAYILGKSIKNSTEVIILLLRYLPVHPFLVVCRSVRVNLPALHSSISFIDPLQSPATPTVQFHNPGQSFTVSWSDIASPFSGYTVSVSPSNPCTESPEVGCNTTYICSGWSASDQLNTFDFRVDAFCGNLVANGSSAARVNLQGTNFCNVHDYVPV